MNLQESIKNKMTKIKSNNIKRETNNNTEKKTKEEREKMKDQNNNNMQIMNGDKESKGMTNLLHNQIFQLTLLSLILKKKKKREKSWKLYSKCNTDTMSNM
jgi:hypothetical protein